MVFSPLNQSCSYATVLISGSLLGILLIQYCIATFSTISTSCKISHLNGGTLTFTSFSFMISPSNLAFSINLFTSSALSDVPPISSLHKSTCTIFSCGVK